MMREYCSTCGFGAVVFFDELQVDIGGGVVGVIEFATVDAEGLGWRYAIINDSIQQFPQ